jgi:hypothetical protein
MIRKTAAKVKPKLRSEPSLHLTLPPQILMKPVGQEMLS